MLKHLSHGVVVADQADRQSLAEVVEQHWYEPEVDEARQSTSSVSVEQTDFSKSMSLDNVFRKIKKDAYPDDEVPKHKRTKPSDPRVRPGSSVTNDL